MTLRPFAIISAIASSVLYTTTLQAQEKDSRVIMDRLARDIALDYSKEYNRKMRTIPVAFILQIPDKQRSGEAHVPAGLYTHVQDWMEHYLVTHSNASSRPYQMVERDAVTEVLKAKKETCAGDVSAACAIELGERLAANSLLIASLDQAYPPSKNWFELRIKVVSVETGGLENSIKSNIYFKTAKPPKPPKDTDRSTTKIKPGTWPSDPGKWDSPIDLRVGGAWENYFNTYRPSGMVEGSYRKNGQSVGIRIGYMPDVISSTNLPYDFGHLVGMRSTEGVKDEDRVVFAGNVPMYSGDIAMLSQDGAPLSFSQLTSSEGDGITMVEFDRIRLSNITVARWSAHALYRRNFTNGYDTRKKVKMFLDIGIGYDWLQTNADYEVERTRTARTAETFAYSTTTTITNPDVYEYDGHRKDIRLGTLLFGAGVEIGRFSIIASWRTVWNNAFGKSHDGYRRVKGDIIYMPILNGSESSSNNIRIALEEDGAVNYGRTNIQPDKKNKLSGNGVNRFTDRSNFMFTLAIRII